MKLKLLFVSILFIFFCGSASAQVIINSQVSGTICDSDISGLEIVDLTNFNSGFSNNPDYIFKYFATQGDAQANLNILFPIQTLTNSKIFYVRVESNGLESAMGILNLTLTSNCQMAVSESDTNKIEVYPNPVLDFIFIKSDEKIIKSEVSSLLGLKLLTSEKENIDLSALNSGVYILKVVTNSFEKSIKIIKK